MCRDVILCVCRDLFPSGRFLLMYRDFVAVSKSMYRCSMTIPVIRLKYLSGGTTDSFVKTSADKLGVDLSSVCKPMCSGIMFGVLNAALRIALYLDLRRRGFDISALRYEDLVARPLDMCRVILEFCHLPVSLAELAVKAFDVDSQATSHMAKSVVGHIKEPQLTPQMTAQLNEQLTKLGVPLIGEPGVVEGTLSCY